MRYFKSASSLVALLLAGFQLTAQPRLSGDIQLTVLPEGSSLMRPRFSPDADKLLLTSDNYTGIYTYSFSTKELTQLASDNGIGFGTEWLTSSSIVLRHSIREGVFTKHAVAVMQTDGELTLFTEYLHSMPSIPKASSSNQVLYYSDKKELKSVPTGFPAKAGKSAPDYVAVGKSLIKIGSAAGTSIQSENIRSFSSDILNLEQSKDGKRLVFEILGGNLMSFDTETGALFDLGRYNRPSFSPDGNYITAMKTTDDGHDILSSEIVVLSFDGSFLTELTRNFELQAMNPHWSPLGNQIVFDSPENGAIYLIPIANQ